VEVTEEIRNDPALKETRVILIGALFRANRFRANPTNLYGADEYIEEQIPEKEFRQIIRKLFPEVGATAEVPIEPREYDEAALLVAQSTDERDLPLMFELLGDKDWRVRKTIVDGFVRDGRLEIVEGLIDALADSENAGKRNSATEALIRIGNPAIESIVRRLRRETDIDVRLSLVNLLGDLRRR